MANSDCGVENPAEAVGGRKQGGLEVWGLVGPRNKLRLHPKKRCANKTDVGH
jgi:hypothetical protein